MLFPNGAVYYATNCTSSVLCFVFVLCLFCVCLSFTWSRKVLLCVLDVHDLLPCQLRPLRFSMLVSFGLGLLAESYFPYCLTSWCCTCKRCWCFSLKPGRSLYSFRRLRDGRPHMVWLGCSWVDQTMGGKNSKTRRPPAIDYRATPTLELMPSVDNNILMVFLCGLYFFWGFPNHLNSCPKKSWIFNQKWHE